MRTEAINLYIYPIHNNVINMFLWTGKCTLIWILFDYFMKALFENDIELRKYAYILVFKLYLK